MKRLIFGCGYLGKRVAHLWRCAGDEVTVVTRSDERARRFAEEGYRPIVADVTRAASLAPVSSIGELDTLLFAVGYDRQAAPTIQQVYAEGFRNVLAALSVKVRRVIYISTTGVYGPAGGEWVNEQTPPNPQRDGGRASLAAEQALRASSLAEGGVVLRLAGIYGPGRIPFLKQLEAGEPIAAPAAGWLNLIHVDDAAQIVSLAAGAENVSQLYCVSDGAPVVRRVYYSEVARLLGVAAPRFVDPPDDSPRAARAKADKRIGNKKLLSELKPTMLHPTYRDGLSSILVARSASG